MCPVNRPIDESEYPGYIQLKITKKDPNSPDSIRDNKITNLPLKEVDSTKLPYYQHYLQNEENYKIADKRLSTVNLLLRSDHVPPKTILEKGGFQPHFTKLHPDEEVNDLAILCPGAHAVNSQRSGSISCTYSLDMIKQYSSYTPNHIYLLKATGGFKETNVREVECEITVPGGVDAEDIVAFRQLAANGQKIFDPDKLLFININFVRRYPQLISYILDRFLEPDEVCPEIEDILSNLPGAARSPLSENATLNDIKEKIGDYFNNYIKDDSPHKERATEVYKAIQLASNVDDIWYVLENQYTIFARNNTVNAAGSVSLPGLKAYYSSRKNVNLENSDSYRKLIENTLSIMPRSKLLELQEEKNNSQLSFESADKSIQMSLPELHSSEIIPIIGESLLLPGSDKSFLIEQAEESSLANKPNEKSLSCANSEFIEESTKALFERKIILFKNECDTQANRLKQYDNPIARHKAQILGNAAQLLEEDSPKSLSSFYRYICDNQKELTKPHSSFPKDLLKGIITFVGYILGIYPGILLQKRFFDENRPTTTGEKVVEPVLKEINIKYSP